MQVPAKIVVVGFGLIGKRHVEAIKQTATATLAAVVEPNEKIAADANHLKVPVFATLEAMFEQVSPDGVILATPTSIHVAQGLTCVAQRCPVLIEKPLAVTAESAKDLTQKAQTAGVPILVGHHRRHNPLVQKAHEIIQSGEIGDIRILQSTCWFYKPDDYFEEAQWRKQPGAGPVSVNLAHDIDLMRHFCGEVVSVQAQAARSARGYENEDVAAAVLGFESGAIGTITVSDAVVAPWSWELTSGENPIYPQTSQSCYQLGGSAGSMSLPDLRIWNHKGERSWWNPITATNPPCASFDPLNAQIAHFVDVIHDKTAPLVSAQEGFLTLQVIEAIQTAAVTKEQVWLG